jgi:hypothetical protein
MKSKRRMPAESRSNKLQVLREAKVSQEQCLLIQEEIWRVVANAEQTGASICAGAVARKIETVFSASGLSSRDIADALIYAAVDAGVAVERQMSVPRPFGMERLPRFSFAALRGGKAGGGLAAPPSATGLEART